MTNIAQANEKTSKCHATRADRRRPCSCATRGRRRLQGQTRTHPAAAPHGVRLELPTAHQRQKLAWLYSRYARACERPSKTRPSTQVTKRSNSEVDMKKATHLTSTSVALNRRRF